MRKSYLAVMVITMLFVMAQIPLCCFASPWDVVRINNFSEFLAWYGSGSAGGRRGILTSELVIDSHVELVPGDNSRKEMSVGSYKIRIVRDGELDIDNPNFILFGSREIICVEGGGRLFLKQGELWGNPKENALLIKEGGIYEITPSCVREGKIEDQNREPETTAPAEEGTEGDGSLGMPILADPHAPVPVMTCMEGQMPGPDAYPAKDFVHYQAENGKYEWMEIPVSWDLSSVDFNKAGTYEIKGNFSEEALAANRLRNPDGIQTSLKLVVQKVSPVEILSAVVLSVDSDGSTMVRIKIPSLPKDAKALYLYYSFDQSHYTKASWLWGGQPCENYLENAVGMTDSDVAYVIYQYDGTSRPVWFKIEIVGSIYNGMSEPVKCQAGAASGSSGSSGSPDSPGKKEESDGSSGGNRGGGGQGTTDREGMVSTGPGVSTGGDTAGGAGPADTGDINMGGNNVSGNDISGLYSGAAESGGAGWNEPGFAEGVNTGDTGTDIPEGGDAASVFLPDGTVSKSTGLRAGLSRNDSESGKADRGDSGSGTGKPSSGAGGQMMHTSDGLGESSGNGQKRRMKRYGYALAGSAGILAVVNRGMWRKGKRKK